MTAKIDAIIEKPVQTLNVSTRFVDVMVPFSPQIMSEIKSQAFKDFCLKITIQLVLSA